MRELCLDTETTGLNPSEGHKIVEIACVELVNKVRTGNNFHVYINPRREMPMEAFRVHGLSSEFLQDKPIFAHVAHQFLDFIKGARLIIHNAAFDMKFLNFELALIGLDAISNDNVVDSLVMARNKFPGAANSLDALCKRFNVDLSKRTKHGALLDCELLADVYIELMGGAQAGLAFGGAAAIEEKNDEKIIFEQVRRTLAKREFAVANEDLEKHKEFISKNIKANLWGY
jgi:DNA polymerase-3 subunit epsilon